MTDFVDPEELPFTRDELHAAAQLFLPTEVATRIADGFHTLGPTLVAERAKRREQWRKDGVAGADTMPLHAWAYPDELLPALAALSPDCARRADQLNAEAWAQLRRAAIYQEQRVVAQAAGMIPTLESLMAAESDQRIRQGKRPRKPHGIVVSSVTGEWPEETDAMRQVADTQVAAAKTRWEAAVAHFEQRLAASSRGAV